jgi:hypothetical protein
MTDDNFVIMLSVTLSRVVAAKSCNGGFTVFPFNDPSQFLIDSKSKLLKLLMKNHHLTLDGRTDL